MLSIIIPTYNEQENIDKLLDFLQRYSEPGEIEIIISDGGSTDLTIQKAKAAGVTAVLSPKKGRAAQMNYGASLAKGNILYFIHADTFPPTSFINDIQQAIASGFKLGRYRTRFDSRNPALKFNAFFTRFDLFVCYGGDQTLFIKKDLFDSLKGFDESRLLMEDYDIITRAKKIGKYKVMQKDALVSARKYISNSWLTVQRANYKMIRMYKRNANQVDMAALYKKLLG